MDTLKFRRRLRQKTTPTTTTGATAAQAVKKKRKSKKRVQTGQAKKDDIKLPVKMEKRNKKGKRKAESYILDSSETDRYVAGQTSSACAHFRENVNALFALVEAGMVVSRKAARAWLVEAKQELVAVD